jgi:hypothetical protein
MRPKWGEDGYEEYTIMFVCDGCGAVKHHDSREAHPECDTCWHTKTGPRVMRAATEDEIAAGEHIQTESILQTGKTFYIP